MKTKELIELLSELNPELEVVMSKDSEGNAFSPVDAYCLGQYFPESTWSGDFIGEDDMDDGKDIDAVVLWPVN